jgi:putative oxidoreductase
MNAVASVSGQSVRPHGMLRVALWVAQVLLAGLFGMAGVLKTTKPMAELVQMMVWPGAMPPLLVRFIGAAELAGAVGLLLPALTRIKPILTPLAATGLVIVMVLASIFHISRGELHALSTTLPIGALAAFVAWGRFKKAPIPPRA